MRSGIRPGGLLKFIDECLGEALLQGKRAIDEEVVEAVWKDWERSGKLRDLLFVKRGG